MLDSRNTDSKKEEPGTHDEVSTGFFLSYMPGVFLCDCRKFMVSLPISFRQIQSYQRFAACF